MLASDCSVPLCLTPVYRLVSTQHGRDYDVWKQKVAGKQFSVSLYTIDNETLQRADIDTGLPQNTEYIRVLRLPEGRQGSHVCSSSFFREYFN